jgi:hypothetical protein
MPSSLSSSSALCSDSYTEWKQDATESQSSRIETVPSDSRSSAASASSSASSLASKSLLARHASSASRASQVRVMQFAYLLFGHVLYDCGRIQVRGRVLEDAVQPTRRALESLDVGEC